MTPAAHRREGAFPSVYGFLDYREYLREVYQRGKESDRRFSYRYVASRVGFRSASFLSHVLHGRSEFTPSMALRFASFLRLDARETDYFEVLVLYARSASVAERRRHLGRLATLREDASKRGASSPSPGIPAPEEGVAMLSSAGVRLVEREFAAFRERLDEIARTHPGTEPFRLPPLVEPVSVIELVEICRVRRMPNPLVSTGSTAVRPPPTSPLTISGGRSGTRPGPWFRGSP